MKDKEIKNIAMQLAQLEKEYKNNPKGVEQKMNKLIMHCSLEELLEIDEYILNNKLL